MRCKSNDHVTDAQAMWEQPLKVWLFKQLDVPLSYRVGTAREQRVGEGIILAIVGPASDEGIDVSGVVCLKLHLDRMGGIGG